MRRLDLRPDKKLRNPERHLRKLARWPERIVHQLPEPELTAGDRFWSFKIPVYSKLSDPPHATPETMRACLDALLAAAAAIEASPKRTPNCRVAILATTPWLFESEVTLFFDEGYFRSFLPVEKPSRTEYDGGVIEAFPADPAQLLAVMPGAHGMHFHGGTKLIETRDGETFTRINWVWSFPHR